MILLIGGGYALAEASEQSCLSAWLGSQLEALDGLEQWALSLVSTLLANFFTQILSNSATVSILLPVLIDLALVLGTNPLYLILPVTVACSYAFMLPVSTGPNAVCFGPSGMTMLQMMRLGFVLNLVCLGIITFASNTYGYFMFDLGDFPSWAQEYNSGVNDTICQI